MCLTFYDQVYNRLQIVFCDPRADNLMTQFDDNSTESDLQVSRPFYGPSDLKQFVSESSPMR